jgi:hypothetical protein
MLWHFILTPKFGGKKYETTGITSRSLFVIHALRPMDIPWQQAVGDSED